MRLLGLLFALGVALPRTAAAHQTSIKYADLAIDDERIAVTLRFAPGDVTEAIGLEGDQNPTVAQVLGHTNVAHHVRRWLVIRGCTAGTPSLRAADDKHLAASWVATCAEPTRTVELDLSAFFALDTRHELMVRLTAPHAEPVQTMLGADDTPATLHAGHSASLLAWIRTGMAHIYGGIDHVLFVLALLLVVMLYRAGDWHLRGFLLTLKTTAIVVTAFTIAHSISLIAAALGYVALPSQLVESIIALSIAYTAAENVIRPDVAWRFWLTFGFGLVHGLGFAGVLAVLLPPTDIVVPLLCFNVGVELGQLTIVAVALPALFYLARALGAERYRRTALPALAGLIGLVGAIMFLERVLGVSWLPM